MDAGAAWASWNACWRFGEQLRELWWTGTRDAVALQRAQQQRLEALLVHARAHSPLYARLCRGLPSRHTSRLEKWPRVTRTLLMSHFDEWVTDPAIRLTDLRCFIADPTRIGEPFLDRYVVWSSSGSTGEPGIYVQDAQALAVYDALATTRWPRAVAAPPLQALCSGHRAALVTATGAHFAGIVSWERMRRTYPWLASQSDALSVQWPMAEVVRHLHARPPAVLAAYPTTLLLLAQERAAGRLRIEPQVACSGGETLSPSERQLISQALGCPVVDAYGASECLHMAFECEHGVLHLNSDWVLLEPVDARGHPVAPGRPSRSVLLTNLANWVQPLIRYDLGDSITLLGPCACGSALPALRVCGRRDDILTLRADNGSPVLLAPLALATVVEEGAGVHRFQIRPTGPRSLSVRFDTPPGQGRDATWRELSSSLRSYLRTQGVGRVQLHAQDAPPRGDPVTGKLRMVLGA